MTVRPGWSGAALGEVRPYTVTRGRTRPHHHLLLTTRLAGHAPGAAVALATPEHEALLRLCRAMPYSVAELAARLRQPVQVTKIIAADLLDSRALILLGVGGSPQSPDRSMLEAVLDGLRRL
ncbi:DUF742 domain-containing protein [Streptomyces sp. PTM05]|uniref:DUF742 domain-containing protein n=1 Tax=Streptantibioticus parmotrematis TaxID=2873249 RepID=A0ABS7QVP6_9ACTN|nr:DUF742 domain-containing protein [Streptantibioticus parmotrematis]MBY8887276.1 DUF742 domain-containing protein [Streptantibioticus parmotrematis]